MYGDSIYEEARYNIEDKIDYYGKGLIDDDVEDFTKYNLVDLIKDSSSFKLYRYTPSDYFNIRNIETQKICLTENRVLNDIYEGIPRISEEEKISYYDLQQLKDLAYMKSFSEENDNVLMWSHYADQHEGICVEYDFKKLAKKSTDVIEHLYPVIYLEKRFIEKDIRLLIEGNKELQEAIDTNIEYNGKESFDNILPLFITKGSMWEYEREWRIIYTKKQLYDDYKSNQNAPCFEIGCISAVYLGYRIHPEKKEDIIEKCKRLSSEGDDVGVYQAELDSDGYGISFGRNLVE